MSRVQSDVIHAVRASNAPSDCPGSFPAKSLRPVCAHSRPNGAGYVKVPCTKGEYALSART